MKDYRFKSNLSFDAEKNAWVLSVEGSSQKFFFAKKPEWAITIDKMNEILDKSQNPNKLREYYDKLYEISTKADNVVSRILNQEPLNAYLRDIYSTNILNDLHSLYKLKLISEEKSSVRGGSLPSTACSQMRRYSAVIGAIDSRMNSLSKLNNPYKNKIMFGDY